MKLLMLEQLRGKHRHTSPMRQASRQAAVLCRASSSRAESSGGALLSWVSREIKLRSGGNSQHSGPAEGQQCLSFNTEKPNALSDASALAKNQGMSSPCKHRDDKQHLRKARDSREGAAAAERDAARRGSRMAAACESSPSRAATVAGNKPSLYRRMTTSMTVFHPDRTLSPYLQMADTVSG